jgi:hypothetical protein
MRDIQKEIVQFEKIKQSIDTKQSQNYCSYLKMEKRITLMKEQQIRRKGEIIDFKNQNQEVSTSTRYLRPFRSCR